MFTEYGVRPNADELSCASEVWLSGRKGITVKDTLNGLNVDSPNLRDGSGCFLLNQRIVARSRIVLLEMMEKVSIMAPDVEICYANIDSVHFSVPNIYLDSALEKLRAEASENMGSFKIEAVTRHGLWLEPGRYWLYTDIVEKYRNRSVGSRITPFKDHSIHVTSRKIGELYVPIRATVRMDRTMSATRAITFDADAGIERQRLIEIGGAPHFVEVLDQLEANQRFHISKRMEAFENLRQRLGVA